VIVMVLVRNDGGAFNEERAVSEWDWWMNGFIDMTIGDMNEWLVKKGGEGRVDRKINDGVEMGNDL
jgi:hypothetical protein